MVLGGEYIIKYQRIVPTPDKRNLLASDRSTYVTKRLFWLGIILSIAKGRGILFEPKGSVSHYTQFILYI